MSDDANDKTIAALLRERSALLSQGKDERAAQVDTELAARGYEAPKSDGGQKETPKAPEDPKRQAPQGRSSRPQQNTKD